jgi:hypothetical protein
MQKHKTQFCTYFLCQDKTYRANYKKGAHQLSTLKKNITMMVQFAWSSGRAMVLIANPSQQPLYNGFVEGTDEEFYFIL